MGKRKEGTEKGNLKTKPVLHEILIEQKQSSVQLNENTHQIDRTLK